MGVERRVQHLQQEGLERLPLPVAYLHALSRRRLVDDAHLLGRWDRRDSQNRFRFLENSVSGKWVCLVRDLKVETLG